MCLVSEGKLLTLKHYKFLKNMCILIYIRHTLLVAIPVFKICLGLKSSIYKALNFVVWVSLNVYYCVILTEIPWERAWRCNLFTNHSWYQAMWWHRDSNRNIPVHFKLCVTLVCFHICSIIHWPVCFLYIVYKLREWL